MSDGIVHIEIPVKDLEKTPNFYSKIFGWELTPIPDLDYVIFTADGAGTSGAFVKPSIHAVGGVIAYIQVDNIEEKLDEIAENGGTKQSGVEDVGDAGWFALFTDPDGNALGLWKQNADRA